VSTVTTLPTQPEIANRYRSCDSRDFFGFESSEYLMYLDYETAKAFLKPEVTAEEWASIRAEHPHTREAIVASMLKYMQFAWDKANGQRGISANRSVMHYIAWTWLAGDRDLSDKVRREYDTNYCYYGKPILRLICDHYGWDHKTWDDGHESNGEEG
jgi:hypothetical protein